MQGRAVSIANRIIQTGKNVTDTLSKPDVSNYKVSTAAAVGFATISACTNDSIVAVISALGTTSFLTMAIIEYGPKRIYDQASSSITSATQYMISHFSPSSRAKPNQDAEANLVAHETGHRVKIN